MPDDTTPSNRPSSTPPRGVVSRAATWTLVTLVYVYRCTLGPFMGGHCRFQPTCSQYMLDAVRHDGPWRGAWRGLRRIARCHPFGGSGHDPA